MIDKLASVHPDAKIGDNVTIDAFTTIYKDVEIGSGTWIGPNVTIFSGARIGENVKIYPGAVLAAEPQDLKFKGEYTTIEIGDNTVIREYVTINRGTAAYGKTVIGTDNLLCAYTHIGHDCIVGNNCVFSNAVQIAGHVKVNDWAIIAGTTAIHQFVKIGEHVMIGGGSLVRKDVPPYVKAAREPLSYCGVNGVGLRRRKFTETHILEIQNAYRHIFQRGLPNHKALDEIQLSMPDSEHKSKIIEFIQSSERGIMKGVAN